MVTKKNKYSRKTNVRKQKTKKRTYRTAPATQLNKKQRGGFQDISSAAYINEPGMTVKGTADIPGLSIPSRKALIRSGTATCAVGSHP